MEPLLQNRSEPVPVPASAAIGEPRPWVRQMVAVLLRIGLGVSLLNGGLLGYLTVRRGGPASGLAWTTLIGPASVAGALGNDLFVPFVQIAIGLALILGFFTVVSAILAGFLILSGPIFQFLAILSDTRAAEIEDLLLQALVSTGSVNLLLLVAAVLWLTPVEGTPWSLDFLIFAHRRSRSPGLSAPSPASAPAPRPAPAEPAATGERVATLSASREE